MALGCFGSALAADLIYMPLKDYDRKSKAAGGFWGRYARRRLTKRRFLRLLIVQSRAFYPNSDAVAAHTCSLRAHKLEHNLIIHGEILAARPPQNSRSLYYSVGTSS